MSLTQLTREGLINIVYEGLLEADRTSDKTGDLSRAEIAATWAEAVSIVDGKGVAPTTTSTGAGGFMTDYDPHAD